MRLQFQSQGICCILLLYMHASTAVTANVFTTNSDRTCRNNLDWSDGGKLNCGDVGFIESRRVALCQIEEIHNNCPISCGVCCEDDTDYIFEKDNGMTSGCDWLTANAKNQEERMARYCDTFNNGFMVRAACPKACDYCKSYVSIAPSSNPTMSETPTVTPSLLPTTFPSAQPTLTNEPTQMPTMKPSSQPSIKASNVPSLSTDPSYQPSSIPTSQPSLPPTTKPSSAPSYLPSISNQPTLAHSQSPSLSMGPSSLPSGSPSVSVSPSVSPSSNPSFSMDPSGFPFSSPSGEPSLNPSISMIPSWIPSNSPSTSISPSKLPSAAPTSSAAPTLSPTYTPTMSANPSGTPSNVPSISSWPTLAHSQVPSLSMVPSTVPSSSPSVTMSPSDLPSSNPSISMIPSQVPSNRPSTSVSPSDVPSSKPSISMIPSWVPSSSPSASISPSELPSTKPTPPLPTVAPSDMPSVLPSSFPTSSARPSSSPSNTPSKSPTLRPSTSPSIAPSVSPSQKPTEQPSAAPSERKPNLIMIITDEHNLRTLSVYRDYLLTKHEQTKVDVWGDVHLETPNIDSLANDGALFTNFYSVSPLCTPSRASFMTGLYPPFTGAADQNHGKLDTNIKTWADILREERGYSTSYMGKFHLDGEEKPGWGAPDGREFGFDDNKYRYNRGHWKYFDEANGQMQEYTMDGEANFQSHYNEHFATDFLVDRGMEFIEKATTNKDPFALVLSIPDPHSPNDNRPYYRDMFKDLDFKVPETARQNMKFDPAAGGFNFFNKEEVPVDTVDDFIAKYEKGFFVDHMQQYFGMVKCIDYNIGKLLRKMRDLGIEDDTVVVFTSDHGDLLGEHGKLNKGRPYETSAGIPFIVKYPDRVPAGKIIETAYSSVDFAPTILSLMGVSALPSGVNFQGIDGSKELTSPQMVTANHEQIVFSFDTGKTPSWAAAIKDGYKLVVSKGGIPWLFDIYRDPEEMINYASSEWHRDIYVELRQEMIRILKDYQVPLTEITKMIYLDVPNCVDSQDVLPINNGKIGFCADIGVTINLQRCSNNKISQHCPVTCNACKCEDSIGKIWVRSHARRCDTLAPLCNGSMVQRFCPKTCGTC